MGEKSDPKQPAQENPKPDQDKPKIETYEEQMKSWLQREKKRAGTPTARAYYDSIVGGKTNIPGYKDNIKTKQRIDDFLLQEIEEEERAAKPVAELTPEQKDIMKTRDVADTVLNRIGSYAELNAVPDKKAVRGKKVLTAGEKKEYDEKYKEAFRNTWSADLVVHGIYPVEEAGQNNYPDADGRMALTLLQLAGVDINRVQFVNKSDSVRGKINIDTGDKYGIIVEGKPESLKTAEEKTAEEEKPNHENRGFTITIDHHGSNAKNDTCAAKQMYELLVEQGVLKPKDYLEKAVNFINQIDNKTFPLDKEQFRNYHRTVFGLAESIKATDLIKFFKDGRDPMRPLSDVEIDELDYDKGKVAKEEELIYKSKGLEKKVRNSNERLARMEKDGEKSGMIIDSPKYGKIVVDIAAKKEKGDGTFPTIPCGIDAIKANGYGAYVSWNPSMKSFMVNTVGDFSPEHFFKQGVDMRGRHMWLKPIRKNGEDLEVTLGEILETLTDKKLQATGELKEYLDKEAGKPAEEKKEIPPAPERKPGLYSIPAGFEWHRPPASDEESKSILMGEMVKTLDDVVGSLTLGEGALYGKEETDVLYGKVGGLFKALTGGNLDERARAKATQDAEAYGRVVMKKSGWNGPENVARFTKSIEQRNYGAAVRSGWDKLTGAERQNYHGSIKEYISAVKSQYRDFKKNAVNLSRDAFFELIKQGYKPETFKTSWWFGTQAEMLGPNGEKKKDTAKEFGNWITDMEKIAKEQKDKQVKEAMDKMYGVATANWKKQKIKAAGEVIVEELGPFGLDKAFVKNGKVSSPGERGVLMNSQPRRVVEEYFTPKILSVENEMEAVEAEAARRNKSAEDMVDKIGTAFGVEAGEVAVVKEYVKTGKGDLPPKLPAKVPGLIARLIAKKKEIGQQLAEKLKPLTGARVDLENQQTSSLLKNIERAIADL